MKTKLKFDYVAGIDISKKTLDVCLKHNNQILYEGKINNTQEGLKQLEKNVKMLQIKCTQILFCCETTGLYNLPLLIFIEKKKLNLWLENALSIKKSLGIVRGKTDKIDAQRIANYALRNQEDYRPWKPQNKSIQQLKRHWNTRKRILKLQSQIKAYLTEIREVEGQSSYKEAKKMHKNILNGAEKDVKEIEKKIKETLASDEELKNLHEIITSVDGVGPVTANYLIVATDGFSKINDPRKLACYAGVAPFPYSSGTSVKGRQKVSHFANKELKTLLHLCAVALQKTKEHAFSDFINRKKAEGKHIMSILNALRNKILHVICACVRKNQKYDKNYINSLA